MDEETLIQQCWPPKYDLICSQSECVVINEARLGQEFYVSQIECKLILCPLCRFKQKDKKCPIPGCNISLEKHNLKTTFNIQYKRLFRDLEQEVQEQLLARNKIHQKYYTQIDELSKTDKINQLYELIEDAIQAEIQQNRKLASEIQSTITKLWRQHQMETEDDFLIIRDLPQIESEQHKDYKQQHTYEKQAGLNQNLFHITRIKYGF